MEGKQRERRGRDEEKVIPNINDTVRVSIKGSSINIVNTMLIPHAMFIL